MCSFPQDGGRASFCLEGFVFYTNFVIFLKCLNLTRNSAMIWFTREKDLSIQKERHLPRSAHLLQGSPDCPRLTGRLQPDTLWSLTRPRNRAPGSFVTSASACQAKEGSMSAQASHLHRDAQASRLKGSARLLQVLPLSWRAGGRDGRIAEQCRCCILGMGLSPCTDEVLRSRKRSEGFRDKRWWWNMHNLKTPTELRGSSHSVLLPLG